MKKVPFNSAWPLVVIFVLTGCGQTEGPVEGQACLLPSDCGPAGDALCLAGICRVYDEQSGYGTATVNLSFGRDMYQVATSGYIHFLLVDQPDGSKLTCDELLSGAVDPHGDGLNRLTVNPKYLVFHWISGGTFFPNNLVQFIRPAQGVLAVGEGYAQPDGQGPLTAIGCKADLSIQLEGSTEFSIQLAAP